MNADRELNADCVSWVVIATIVLMVVVLVGVEVYSEMIHALEECAPNCELNG